MQSVGEEVITPNVERFLGIESGDRVPSTGRGRSWDFCFNYYFQDHPQPTRDIELSCLHLGYYLASWGMLRGSSYLARETNVSHYVQAVQVIEAANPGMRGIDADRYHEGDVRALLLETYSGLYKVLLPKGGRGVTLVSKVMMGVWGVLPSFDRYLIKGFRRLADSPAEQSAFNQPSDRSLTLLGEFYFTHATEIDRLAKEFTTVDFSTGQPTDRHLTRAKIIDMFGFQSGYEPTTA